MSALSETLTDLCGLFDGLGLDWFVFGAQAVAVRGAPRATQDIDVTVFVTRSALQELSNRLAMYGLRHRYPDMADELLAAGAVLPLAHRSAMEVDLVVAGSGLERLALTRATPVTHATDLVVMKVLAGRGKDLEDVRAVLAGGEVDLHEARDLLGQLEQALDRSDLLAALLRAVGTDR